MNTELQQLKDIHLPHPVSLWPAAPGWIMVFFMLIGCIGYLFSAWYQRHQKKKAIKFALSKLKKLKDLMSENSENINIAAELSTLIRRAALYYFRREEIAGLSGNDWLNFLNRSGNTTQFTQETGRLLIDAPYRKNNTNDLTPLFALIHAWLVRISKMNRLTVEK